MQQLYFIAILPPKEIQQEVTQFKYYAAEQFQSRHALKSPPHITLQSPFKWEKGEQKRLEQIVQQFAQQQSPFSLVLRNFDSFPPRVIFVDVEKSEYLQTVQAALQQELAQQLKLYANDKHGFHPHMTVAFKDLKRSEFPNAWSYFSRQEYYRQFEVESVTLLQHTGQRWEVVQQYLFGGG